MSRRTTRRQFLSTAAATTAGLTILSDSRSVFGYRANQKLGLAVIGAGGRGAANLQGVKDENIVAFCDVDQRRAADTYAKYPDVKKYGDYRKLLDELDDQLDGSGYWHRTLTGPH